VEQIKVLQISKKIPYPQHDGESVASYALAKGLRAISGVTIDLLSLHTNKHKTDETEARKNLNSYDNIHFIDHDLSVEAFTLVRHTIAGKSYNICRFHSRKLEERLKHQLTNYRYDIVLLETIYTSSYINTIRRMSPHTSIVLRIHNIEYIIWQQKANLTKNPAKKILFNSLSKQLKKYTINVIPKIDRLVTISTSDHEWVVNSGLINVVDVSYQPIGIDHTLIKTNSSRIEEGRTHIGFIGAMDWDPNVDGLEWFVSKVWQPFFENQNQCQLHLAGRKYPIGKYAKVGGIVEHGQVPDAGQFLARVDILIAPLFIGSGVRVKILESMAAGKAVITTSIGISGINAVNGKEIIIANDDIEFKQAIDSLSQKEDLLYSFQKMASMYIQCNYEQKNRSEQLYKLLKEVKQAKTP